MSPGVERLRDVPPGASRQPALSREASSGSPAFIASDVTRKITTPSMGAAGRSSTCPNASRTSPTTVPLATRWPTSIAGCQYPVAVARIHASFSRISVAWRGSSGASARTPAARSQRRSPAAWSATSSAGQRPWPPTSASTAGIPRDAAAVVVVPGDGPMSR